MSENGGDLSSFKWGQEKDAGEWKRHLKMFWLHQIQMYYLSSCFDPSALEDGLNFAAGLGEAGRCLVDGFLAIEAEVEMGFGVEMDKEEEMGLLADSWLELLFSWDTSFDSFLKAIRDVFAPDINRTCFKELHFGLT